MKEGTSTIDTLFEQLTKELETRGEKLARGLKCVVKFEIDGDTWTLELLDGTRRLTKGDSELEADVELRASEADFIRLIMGKLTPQTAFMLGKLKLSGDIATALKLTPILEAARPKPKL